MFFILNLGLRRVLGKRGPPGEWGRPGDTFVPEYGCEET